MIDLDSNATTRPTPEVIAAVTRCLEAAWHNPSSVHRAGQEARRAVELARQHVADLLGTRARQVTFTSGGTESNALAIRGTLAALPPARRVLVTTAVEHASVRALSDELADANSARGAAPGEVRLIPLDRAGVIDVERAAPLLAGAALASVQWANNETGAIQPVARLADLCKAARVPLHVDGTQWVGKVPTRVEDLGCDLLTCAPHKFHGLKGVGILWARPGVGLRPQALGTQERGRRGGTENVPGIVAAGVAAEQALAWLGDDDARDGLATLRDDFESHILSACAGAQINGPTARGARLWNTTNIAFPRLEAEAILMALSERGVCASAGAACSSGSLDPSPVLLAMGVPPELAHGSVRFSLSRFSTRAEVVRSAEVVIACVKRVGASLPPR